MKCITRLSLALMMFSLFSISYFVTSVSADMYNPPPNPANDPSNTMKSESVDLNKQRLQLHKRIEELENQLNKERAKSDKFSADLNKQTAQSQNRIEELENQLNQEKAKGEKFYADKLRQVEKQLVDRIGNMKGELERMQEKVDFHRNELGKHIHRCNRLLPHHRDAQEYEQLWDMLEILVENGRGTAEEWTRYMRGSKAQVVSSALSRYRQLLSECYN